MTRIAVFASGSGSNASQIFDYFRSHPTIEVALLVCNRKEARVLQIASDVGIAATYVPKPVFEQHPDELNHLLKTHAIDFIALAGFLLMLPKTVTEAFAGRVLNVHPALLPAFGGLGMYGHHVHKAVRAAGVAHTGATIHLVNEHYDKGKIIFQASCPVFESDTESDIAARVLKLEHTHYSFVIEQFIATFQKKNTISK